MKYFLLLVLFTGTLTSFGQRNAEPYGRTITADDLKRHLFIVAGPEMQGRETATEGQRRAAAYLVSQFRALGLEPANNGSYEQSFPVYQDTLLHTSVEINGVSFEAGRDYNINITGNFPGTLRFSEVVVAGAQSLDSLRQMPLAGKLVLLFARQMPGRRQGPTIFSVLQDKGVAAILSVQDPFPRGTLTNRYGSQTVTLFRRSVFPQQYMVSPAMARAVLGNALDSAIAGGAPVIIPAQITLDLRKETIVKHSTNVMAMIPGTDRRNEYLFLTAHYDHLGMRGDSVIYYGADDDGSGTVALLEIAEAFMKAKAAGRGPRRTIVFMAVSGEEKGLWGSAYYTSNPVFPLENTTANLNIDMIGRIDPRRGGADSLNYIYVIGDDRMSSELRPVSESVNNRYTRMVLDYRYNGDDPQRFFFRSDHYNFARHGVPVIFYFNGTHADYHRPTDTPDKINYPLLARRAQLVFYTAWEMANRNQMLKRDIPLDTSVFGN